VSSKRVVVWCGAAIVAGLVVVVPALHAGEFAVFVPGDRHRPSLHLDGPHVSRKAVAKVSVPYRGRQRAAKAG
jgi:hypothetical protein